MPIRTRLFVVLLAAAALPAAVALAQPPEVPPKAERGLDPPSYVALAQQWQRWIEDNGPSSRALANLAMAYEYGGETEAALRTARKAVALGPDDPRALVILGKLLLIFADAPDSAVTMLEHCREVAPDYGYGLTMLASAHLRRGELKEAGAVFRTIFERRVLSQPMQDYGYNMLVGLPENAVLITAGDNDTYAPLALQAGLGLRRDVLVLNLSLLNLKPYAEAAFARRPELRPDVDIEHFVIRMVDGHPALLSTALVERLMAEGKAPVYLAATIPEESRGFAPETVMEGMNCRASGKGLAPEAAARLFLGTYRLDSATDWNQPWSLAPSQTRMMANYVAAMAKAAQQKGVAKDTRNALLDRAEAIARYHELTRMLDNLQWLRKKL